MNELVFFSHLVIVILGVLVSLKLGRETLLASVAVQAILANLFVLKQISLFGLYVTSCEVYTVGCLLAINLLQEYFPTRDMRPALFTYFGGLIFFVVMTQFHLHYAPAGLSTINLAYEEILSSSPRIFFASITASALCMSLDIWLFAFLKKRFAKAPFALRLGSAALIVQLIDTCLFTYLGLWGLVSHISHIICVSYLIKVITILIMSSLVALSQKTTLLRDDA